MKTSGVPPPRLSWIGSAPRKVVSNRKSVTTLIPVSLVKSHKSGVIAFDQGWIAPAKRYRLPRKLFPIYRGIGIDRGDILCETPPRQHGEGRHKATPAAPNRLTKLRRLADSWMAWRIFTLQLFIWSHVVLLPGDPGLGLHNARAGPCP